MSIRRPSTNLSHGHPLLEPIRGVVIGELIKMYIVGRARASHLSLRMLPMDQFIERFRFLPPAPAPNDDVLQIKSNLSLIHKQISANILAYHCSNDVFGHKEADGLKLIELWVREVDTKGTGTPLRLEEDGTYSCNGSKPGTNLEGRTICEITVTPSKPNDATHTV